MKKENKQEKSIKGHKQTICGKERPNSLVLIHVKLYFGIFDVRPFLFRVIYTINQFLTFYYTKEQFVLFE